VANRYVNGVRDESKTRGPSRLVLWAIASRTDPDGYAFPGLSCLARDTKLSIRSVRRALNQIPCEELQIVVRGGSAKGQKKISTRYRVLLGADDHAPNAQSNHAPNAQSQSDTVRQSASDHARTDHSTVRNGAPDCARTDPLTIEQDTEHKWNSRARRDRECSKTQPASSHGKSNFTLPTEEEIRSYASSRHYTLSFAKRMWSLFVANNWKYFGQNIASTAQWRAIMDTESAKEVSW
jgi:hypothetical protein